MHGNLLMLLRRLIVQELTEIGWLSPSSAPPSNTITRPICTHLTSNEHIRQCVNCLSFICFLYVIDVKFNLLKFNLSLTYWNNIFHSLFDYLSSERSATWTSMGRMKRSYQLVNYNFLVSFHNCCHSNILIPPSNQSHIKFIIESWIYLYPKRILIISNHLL